MKFGFNVITEKAKEYLGDIPGARWYLKDTLWIVETETFDRKETEFRELSEKYNLELETPDELKKEERSQGTRIWKNPDTGWYYYLIGDTVFFMKNRNTLDYRANPPTTYSVSIFDVVDKEDQERYRDILIQRPPNADIEHGGVLI